jgi:hypothetical protein
MCSSRAAEVAQMSVQQKQVKPHLPIVNAHHEEQGCIATVHYGEALVLYEICLHE